MKRFACVTCEFDIQLNIDGRRCLLEQLQHDMHPEQISKASQSTMAKFPWATPMQRTSSPLPWVELNSCSSSRWPEEESGGEASPNYVDHVQFVRELAESGVIVRRVSISTASATVSAASSRRSSWAGSVFSMSDSA